MRRVLRIISFFASFALFGCVSDLDLGGEPANLPDAGADTGGGDAGTEEQTDSGCCDAEALSACQSMAGECDCECDDETCTVQACEAADDS